MATMRGVKGTGIDRAELEALGREHGSWAAVARVLGKPRNTVAMNAMRHGLASPHKGVPLPRVLAAVRAHGSQVAAARALGLTRSAVCKRLRRAV